MMVSYETYEFPKVYQSKDKATEVEFMLEQGRHLKSSYPKDGVMQCGLPLLLGIPQLCQPRSLDNSDQKTRPMAFNNF